MTDTAPIKPCTCVDPSEPCQATRWECEGVRDDGMPERVHYAKSAPVGQRQPITLCGTSANFVTRTTERADVTCKLCLRAWECEGMREGEK